MRFLDGEKSWKVRSMATSKYHSALPVREHANSQFGRATTDDTILVVKKQHLQFQLTPLKTKDRSHSGGFWLKSMDGTFQPLLYYR